MSNYFSPFIDDEMRSLKNLPSYSLFDFASKKCVCQPSENANAKSLLLHILCSISSYKLFNLLFLSWNLCFYSYLSHVYGHYSMVQHYITRTFLYVLLSTPTHSFSMMLACTHFISTTLLIFWVKHIRFTICFINPYTRKTKKKTSTNHEATCLSWSTCL